MAVQQTGEDLIQNLINAIESKDRYTQGHSHHVMAVVEAIYDSLPLHYTRVLDREKLLNAALLHDVGKVKVDDAVLNKEVGLSDEEWAAMKQHPEHGVQILQGTVFSDLSDWILYHHERIDGKGYYGLKGDDIPLESRIIAIADTFSALRTYRVYRPAKSITETISILYEIAGTQLDAEILEHFLSLDISVLEALECHCDICQERKEALLAA